MNDPHRLGPLLDGARQGDRDALNALLAKLRPYLHVLVRARLGPDLGNSDIVQDTLQRIYQGFGQFRGQSVPQLLAWIAPVVRTAVAQSQRGRKKHPLAGGSKMLTNLVSARDKSPSEQGIEREEADQRAEELVRLTAALEQLPEHKREVLQLRFFQGLPFAEIGQRMGKKEGACRVLCLRAVGDLRQLMEKPT
jgi:RNA polymerase sigma-70 factor (ECF subfamily)